MGAGGSSVVGNLVQRRANLQKQRQRLTGGADRGAPQAPTRSQPNPPPPSPQQPESARPEQAQGQQPPQNDEEARVLVEGFLGETGAQTQGRVPVPRGPRIQGVDTRATPGTPLLGDRINQLGAAGRPPEVQFFRLAGREPSPRELALFMSRRTLEDQLGRPPTVNEFRTHMMRSSSVGPLFSPAVEQSVAQGPPPGA